MSDDQELLDAARALLTRLVRDSMNHHLCEVCGYDFIGDDFGPHDDECELVRLVNVIERLATT